MAQVHASDPIRFRCPHCGERVKAPRAAAGRLAKCPACKSAGVVPYEAAVIQGASGDGQEIDDLAGGEIADSILMATLLDDEQLLQERGIDFSPQRNAPTPPPLRGTKKSDSLRILLVFPSLMTAMILAFLVTSGEQPTAPQKLVMLVSAALAANWLIWGAVGRYVAREKGRSPVEGVLFGALLGPVGCIIAALLPEKRPQS